MVERNEGCLSCEHYKPGCCCLVQSTTRNYLNGREENRFLACETKNVDCLCRDFKVKLYIRACIDPGCKEKARVYHSTETTCFVKCGCSIQGPKAFNRDDATIAWNRLPR